MKYLVSAAVASLAMVAVANAAPMTIGGVDFDSSNTPVDVKIAQGGHFVGPPAGQRFVGDDVPEVEGFDLDTSWEIDSNGTSPDDVLSLLFASPLANGAGACTASADPQVGATSAASYAGCDLIVFEILNQPDQPTLSLTLGGVTIYGVLLADVEIDTDGDGKADDPVAIWGYDLGELGVALDALASNPLFLGRDVGTPDIAAVVGMNFGVIPLPAAAPLFFAGLAGLGFAGRRKKRA